ncbi:MAG: hypothetical protein QM687_01405 [Ferruginibacter sp.]
MTTPLNQHEALLEEVIHSTHPEELTHPQLHANLSAAINDMIVHHFDELIQLLYRMDVSETKLKEMLHQHAAEDASDIIAALIIERQQQKIKARAMFKAETNIPEEEKW